MWYAVISEDNEDSLSARLGARQAHINRLAELGMKAGCWLPGRTRQLIRRIRAQPDSPAAWWSPTFRHLTKPKSWADADPYVERRCIPPRCSEALQAGIAMTEQRVQETIERLLAEALSPS